MGGLELPDDRRIVHRVGDAGQGEHRTIVTPVLGHWILFLVEMLNLTQPSLGLK